MTLSTDFDDRRPWLRRIISLAVLLGVVGGVAYAAYYFGFRDDSPAKTTATFSEATVTKGQIVSSFTTTGTAASTLTTKLTFQASGQVKTVGVVVGDKVTAGQELARLDDRDASRKLESSRSSLAVAQIRLQQLLDPPKAADVASAQQSVASALGQLASAQANLEKATAGPADADVLAADAAIAAAENALTTANNQIDTTWTGLLSAQRNYCVLPAILVNPCYAQDIPLSDLTISGLTASLRNPPGSSAQGSAIVSAITSLFSANTSYLNSKNGTVTAQNNIDTARAKKKALFDPPSASNLAQLQTSVTTATAGLVSAQAKLDQVNAGTTAADIALQGESVKQQQISLQQQQDAYDSLVLRAPYAGTVGAVAINVGDQVGPSTAAVTLTNPEGVRVDLTVSETDLSTIKQGQYGVATFDALAGNFYLLKITGVSTTPTVTQGIVTYPVQAQILRGPDLAANAAGLQQVAAALTTLGGGTTRAAGATAPGGAVAGAGQGGPGAAGAGGFQGGAGAQGGAQRTPGAAAAGRTPGAGAQGAAGGGILASIANAPLPSPGMSASVTVILSVTQDALLLPTAAIKRSGRTSVVSFKLPDGTTEQRTVTTGGTDGSNTAILTGLVEGDVVQIGGATASAAAGRTPTPAAGGRQPTPAGGVR
ncbi:MAG: HlyD family efflux transporter periplasmic adaptor subunit [Anaerolineaceae bacterium]